MKNFSTFTGQVMRAINAALFLLISLPAFAQYPSIQWQKCYGGSAADGANNIVQTSDGGYISSGFSCSVDSQVTGNHGGFDCWIIKTDSNGTLQWEKSYGGSLEDEANQIYNDVNGGYVFVAGTYSNDGDVSGNHGGGDAWIVKIDDTGRIVWDTVLGSSGFDYFDAVINTPDSGYLAIGGAGADNGDVSGLTGESGVWAVKFTKTGALSWKKVYGGTGQSWGINVMNTPDNGFMVVSETDGEGITGSHGGEDAWIIKLNDTGGLMWSKAYGGSGTDYGWTIAQLKNGNYVVGVASNSTDGQVTGNHGSFDYWIFAINDTGALLWEKSYGGIGYDWVNNVFPTTDSGAVLAGFSDSLSDEVTSYNGITGCSNYWLVKINDTGGIVWENSYGGSNCDTACWIIQTSDGGYMATGGTMSDNWDVSGNHGTEDYWLVKLYPDPPLSTTAIHTEQGIRVYPNPANDIVTISASNINASDARITLTSITGSVLVQKELGNIAGNFSGTIDITTLPVGMYFVTLHTETESYVMKMVKVGE